MSLVLSLLSFGISAACIAYARVTHRTTQLLERTSLSTLDEIRQRLQQMDAESAASVGVFAEVKGTLTGLNEFVTGSITQTSALMCETIVERLVEELQPFAVNPLADPTQPLLPSVSPPHHAWLSSPQLLSHTLQSAPVYLDAPPSASPLLLALPLSCFTHLLVTTADHISPPSLAEAIGSSAAGLPVLRLNAFTLPFSPLVLSASIRCVGYRFIERLLPLGREVEAVGRVQMTAEGALRMVEGSGQVGEKVMLMPVGEGADAAAAGGGAQGAEAVGREIERRSRESEYGLELIATVTGVVGCVSLCWWWMQKTKRRVNR